MSTESLQMQLALIEQSILEIAEKIRTIEMTLKVLIEDNKKIMKDYKEKETQ